MYTVYKSKSVYSISLRVYTVYKSKSVYSISTSRFEIMLY